MFYGKLEKNSTKRGALMIIDVFQDLVCPWCRIGKKNLMDAIEEWKKEHQETITIRYRSFFLDPTIPADGLSFYEVMARKMGGAQMVERVINHVTETGKSVGVPFRFDRVTLMPNTKLSHTLMKIAPEHQVSEVVEEIYQAYFEEGKDIGNIDVLIEIAHKLGLDQAVVRTALESHTQDDEINQDLDLARQLQIRGVPFFIIDEKLALSGAHSKENFLKAFQEARSITE
jgi:predicted DsbA family dithiol-disulfide isomerase